MGLGKQKIVRDSREFEITKFEITEFEITGVDWGQGKQEIVRDSGEFEIARFYCIYINKTKPFTLFSFILESKKPILSRFIRPKLRVHNK